eukprot:3946980-Amphidinium_carterae.1
MVLVVGSVFSELMLLPRSPRQQSWTPTTPPAPAVAPMPSRPQSPRTVTVTIRPKRRVPTKKR